MSDCLPRCVQSDLGQVSKAFLTFYCGANATEVSPAIFALVESDVAKSEIHYSTISSLVGGLVVLNVSSS